jgi:hypothetical protein
VTVASRTVSSAINSSSALEDSDDDMALVLKPGSRIL